jgi:hypothetical protein
MFPWKPWGIAWKGGSGASNNDKNYLMKRKNYPTTRVILSLCFLIGLTGFHPLLAQGKQDWVAKSDAYTAKLLEVMARHNPESAARIGVEGHDEEISDLSAGFREKELKDLEDAHAYLLSEYEKERDRALKQDLQILISSVSDGMESSALEHAQLLPYHPVAGNIYHGIKSLLEDRVPAERREAALVRLRKYAVTEKGYRPYPVLAMEDMQREWTSQPDRLPPFKDQLERDLTTSRQYMEEIGTLFEKYGIGGYQKDYKVLKEQLERYENYLRETILPQARTDFRLPPEIYASNLKDYGVDMPIDELQRRAKVTFKELQTQMQVLANIIARKHNYPSNDYRDVIRSLKKEQLDSTSTLPLYNQVIDEIESIVRREGLLTLPDRSMTIRLASEAESASTPSPFMSPPRLIGNTGEYGEFVLPLKVSGGSDGSALMVDDFTHKAAAWPLTAHEGRPGHELQFTAMVERGVSQARMIFAMNSVNVEGWALYAEEIIQPFLPVEGQFMTLWSRLVRSGRAFLDPGLNLGTLTVEEARYVLQEEIVLSEALVRSELERYRFRGPGQATSYLNGYLRMMELRAETELSLGTSFDPLAFHDYVLSLGLLPPALISEAVREDFIPSQR